ncbi:MAG: HEAT repeat domain-containing protein [Gemmatimonadaceae bacterium]
MDHSATFARHFARLVWLLINEVGSVDEQKMSLRALVTVSRGGPVTLLVHELHLLANDQLVPGALTGVRDVASQMTAHSVERIQLDANSRAADILGLARILAATAATGDGGAQATQKLAALSAKTITAVMVAPAAPPPVAPAPAPAEASREREPSRAAAAEAITLVTPIGAGDVTRLSPEELFAALANARDVDGVTRALDDLVTLAEHSVRIAKAPVVGTIFHEIVSRDKTLPDGEIKRAYVMAIRRLSKPTLLRAVASMIPRKPERRQQYYEVLARTGEEGADALIEQITQAPTAADRVMLMEVLTVLDDAVPALVRMLGDSRWFVVRNATDLLGEMGAVQAEGPLIALLRHADDRVRRSVTGALMKLGTPDALRGIYDAVHDASPEVRMQVAAAIANRKDSKTSTTLIRAVDEEADGDVQLVMIAALGRVATNDAVQKLVKIAEPEGRLFRKKDTSLRVAAIQALGEARTPAAIAALREFVGDKEREVRDTAGRALAHAGR